MAAPIRPTPVSIYGRENWIYVPTLASVTAPTATEVNSASGLDITNIVFADTAKPAQSTNRVTQERRLGDTVQFEFIGNTTWTGGDMHYQFDAQAAAGATGKKFYGLIPAGTSAFLVQRVGKLNSVTPVSGDFVNVYPVSFGPSFPLQAGDGETAESGMTATFALIATPTISVALT